MKRQAEFRLRGLESEEGSIPLTLLISAGIFAALYVAYHAAAYSEMMVHARQLSEIRALESSLATILGDVDMCRASVTLTGVSDGSSVEIRYPGTGEVIAAAGSSVRTGGGSLLVERLTMENVALVSASPVVLKSANLLVRLVSTNSRDLARKPRVIPFYFIETGGVMSSCFGKGSPAYLCQELNGNYDPNGSPRCTPVLKVASAQCPPDQFVSGVTSTGGIECR